MGSGVGPIDTCQCSRRALFFNLLSSVHSDEESSGEKMQTPVQISFEHLEHSGAIEHRVREHLDKLEQFCGRLTSARVVVAREQRRHNKGDNYSVRLLLSVPGAEDIAITHTPEDTGRHEDIHVVISDAFAAARRQLQDLVGKRQRRHTVDEADPGGE